MQKGKIGVTTENIFPVIKKFLYSDHDIFLREIVSNAIDATQKLKTLSSCGEFKGELGDLKVRVTLDKENGTLTVSDAGIGMTAEDVEKYINQIAFSGAEEFLAKYKDNANAIIGHFGLGFYSAFMVSKKVEIRTLSYKEGAKAISWVCDGSPEYELTEIEKAERGTDIILYIDDECKEFLEKDKIESLLKKYCKFLPVPIVFGKKQEWKDGKFVDTEEDNVINDTKPAWTLQPSELKDEDYLKFYHELYPGNEDPLFWIHLNVDFPFTLTGILYFPKLKNNLDAQQNRIQLYCNQVFVTDSVEGVVPDFMMIMRGVIDSPDIPLNVSRSYLQSDANVKKISSYITKKVASQLENIFKTRRQEFEEKWNDIKIFIEYGMLTDDKFCDSAMKFALLPNTDDKKFTLDEYKQLIESNQTDKDGNLIYLYTTDKTAQYSYIKAATDKGYDVLVIDDQLGSHFVGLLERKLEKSRFVRVDSDVIENLIVKEDRKTAELSTSERNIMTELFKSQIPTVEKSEFLVSFEALSENTQPVQITQSEYMRRMKEMAAMQSGMSFYGDLPDSYSVILNTEHPLIKRVMDDAKAALNDKVMPMEESIDSINKTVAELRDKKDATEAEKLQITENEAKAESIRKEENEVIRTYAASNPLIKQLIDLALLGNNLLKGQALDEFLKRSVELLK
jgi:molecular chaperone HtpG